MRIHGTAKAGISSIKNFGVAFGGAPVTPSSKLWEQTLGGEEDSIGSAPPPNNIIRIAQRFQTGHVCIGKTITKVVLSLKKAGSPISSTYITIIDSSDVQKLLLGVLDSAILTTSYASYTFENTDGYVLANNDRIGAYNAVDYDPNKVKVQECASCTESYTNVGYYISSWVNRDTSAKMEVWGY